MDIDITDLKSFEIIQVLENYPRGSLGQRGDRIFWCSIGFEPERRNPNITEKFDPRRTPKGEGDIGKRFEKMGDTLGRLMGPGN
jgi:hypothetical protein